MRRTITEWVRQARVSEHAHGPEEAHARAELRERLRDMRDHLTVAECAAAAGCTADQVLEWSNPNRASSLTTAQLRAAVPGWRPRRASRFRDFFVHDASCRLR